MPDPEQFRVCVEPLPTDFVRPLTLTGRGRSRGGTAQFSDSAGPVLAQLATCNTRRPTDPKLLPLRLQIPVAITSPPDIGSAQNIQRKPPEPEHPGSSLMKDSSQEQDPPERPPKELPGGAAQALSSALKKTFDALLEEPVPEKFDALIARIREEEMRRNAGNDGDKD
ncbi:hypothetical protein [Hyphomonas jannaschiana]|uniref:hypothetical protein n=2 Tax=Hyphomonas TaxID=85 RepID=UPI0035C6F2AD